MLKRLTREFDSISNGARSAMENIGKTLAVAQGVEMLTMISALEDVTASPAAPATVGVSPIMGSDGVMAGSQRVVCAEWVEMIRRLVQAGVIFIPAVSAAVRLHGGQVLMAQAHGDLPEGLRDAPGDRPEVTRYEGSEAGCVIPSPRRLPAHRRDAGEYVEVERPRTASPSSLAA